ncbi:MAG: polyamine ABC transporter substrate-binding protein [Gammaproteobacteria bacterium]|jgi:putrescine transport system substrate-binding protein|nr:polyamine ABC transporter substrate-binding protein [Gammaproteobacteria bacterium]MCP4880877.1 polyamine ABC transporter substrate-binding protein [Gammaproteobacteria bacterium]
MKKITSTLATLACATGLMAGSVQAEEVLHIYNWSDYIAEDTIANFEAETGIKVVYDMFDSNDVLEAKLLTGNSGYDLVVPSSSFMGRQIMAGVFQKLDKSQLPNLANMDAEMMATITGIDPGNAYGVPYMWGTTGIGYNIDMVEKALGADAPVGSWDLVLKPENMAKLASCGVHMLDSADEILPIAMNYLDLDPNSTNKADWVAGAEVVKGVRDSVTKFHSSNYIDALANGDICVAVGWSGDVFMAAAAADEAENGVAIDYVIPAEGAPLWIDMMGIPADAKNVGNAHKFLNYLMRPEVAADITNYVWYANANAASSVHIEQEILDHPGIYPTAEAKTKLFTFNILPPKVTRAANRAWTDVRTGN